MIVTLTGENSFSLGRELATITTSFVSEHGDLALGASPRGSLALYKTSQALAALRGRDYVIPDDIKLLAPLTLAHRLILKPESQLRGRNANMIINEILEKTVLDIGSLPNT